MIEVHDFRLLGGDGRQASFAVEGGEIKHVILDFDVYLTPEEVEELYRRMTEFNPEDTDEQEI